jgi:hypothetical protein
VQEKLTKSQVKDGTNLQGMAPIFWSVFIGKKIKQGASKKGIIINNLQRKLKLTKDSIHIFYIFKNEIQS